MDIRKNLIEIYTSDEPDRTIDTKPLKSPYFVIKFPRNKESELINSLLAKLGIINIDNQDKLVFTITSYYKIIQAIDFVLKKSDNKDILLEDLLYQYLISYKEICEKQLKEKEEQQPPSLPPSKSRLDSDYEEKPTNTPLRKTAHITRIVTKKKSPEKEYIFKENQTGRSISELEAYNALCHRLLLGNHHPKVRAVHNSKGKPSGLISEKIPQFESLQDIFENNGKFPTSEDLLDAEVMKVWAAAFIEEENDLNVGNYGIGPDGKAVKLDDNQTTYSETSIYNSIASQQPTPEFGYDDAPINSFPVTKEDIKNFPKLKNAKPKNWPDKIDAQLINIDYFIKNKKSIEDKFYIFLKRILIPDKVYEASGIIIRSDKKRKRMIENKINKTINLKKVLLEMPEFLDYLNTYPTVIDQITSEFAEYNKDYKKIEDQIFCVNLKEIQNKFDQLKKQAEHKKLEIEFQDLVNQLEHINDNDDIHMYHDIDCYIQNILSEAKKVKASLTLNEFSTLNQILKNLIEFIKNPSNPNNKPIHTNNIITLSNTTWGDLIKKEMVLLQPQIEFNDACFKLEETIQSQQLSNNLISNGKNILICIKKVKKDNTDKITTEQMSLLSQSINSVRSIISTFSAHSIENYRKKMLGISQILNNDWGKPINQAMIKFNRYEIIPSLLQLQIVDELDGNNKHEGIRNIVQHAKLNNFTAIIEEAKHRTSRTCSIGGFLKNSLILHKFSTREDSADLFYWALAQYYQNVAMYFDISTITDLLTSQQKRNAITIFEDEINRLATPYVGTGLYGGLRVMDGIYNLDSTAYRKIIAYQDLIKAIKNSNVNETLVFILIKNKEALEYLTQTRGWMKATSQSIIEEMLASQDPTDMVNSLKIRPIGEHVF